MNLTILLALIIAAAAIYILKSVVKHVLLREAGPAERSEVRQQAAGTTR
jgi:hypothetical protein